MPPLIQKQVNFYSVFAEYLHTNILDLSPTSLSNSARG